MMDKLSLRVSASPRLYVYLNPSIIQIWQSITLAHALVSQIAQINSQHREAQD